MSPLSLYCLLFPFLITARLTSIERSANSSNRGCVRAKAPIYCTTPVTKAPVIFPDSLIGRAPHKFNTYSGYVNVTTQDWLFYWFVENAKQDPKAPLIIWTNGGPGCTSMEGATTEHGPFVLQMIKEACTSRQCDYTQQLSLNPYSWNQNANVLYLDQPRYVGYSFGYGPSVKSTVDAAADVITFIQGWLNLFPEFKGVETYISGESYAGHYMPAWADAILNYNQKPGPNGPINFKGVAIGNGCVNDTVQNTKTYIEFLHDSNLIPADSNPATREEADRDMNGYIGYSPNYYDYRVQCVSCSACYCYNYTAWSYWFLRKDVHDNLHACGDAGNQAFSGSAGGCIDLPGFDTNDKFDYSGALARTLQANIPVVFYYGKADTACDYVGGYTMANTIPWSGQSAFNATNLSSFKISGAVAGQMKQYGLLTWIQVESAGHMVPLDQPAGASFAITHLLGLDK